VLQDVRAENDIKLPIGKWDLLSVIHRDSPDAGLLVHAVRHIYGLDRVTVLGETFRLPTGASSYFQQSSAQATNLA
jgi:hypothetical protein